jgi:hypothetical protein
MTEHSRGNRADSGRAPVWYGQRAVSPARQEQGANLADILERVLD